MSDKEKDPLEAYYQELGSTQPKNGNPTILPGPLKGDVITPKVTPEMVVYEGDEPLFV